MLYIQSIPNFANVQKDHGLLRMQLHSLRVVTLFLTCTRGLNQERVIVKTAPTKRLNNEAQTLQLFQGCHSIRQLVDQIEDPESVVLEYMDDNVLNLLQQKQLSKLEAKRALRATIEALVALHDKNIVHTGTLRRGGLTDCEVIKND